jgi:hypothetical protein
MVLQPHGQLLPEPSAVSPNDCCAPSVEGVSYAEAWTTCKTMACLPRRPLLWSPLGRFSALCSSASLCSTPPEDTSMVDEKIRVGLIGANMHRGWCLSAQLKGMDAEGIDVAIIYPSRGTMGDCMSQGPPHLPQLTLASRPCLCAGYTLARHEVTHVRLYARRDQTAPQWQDRRVEISRAKPHSRYE